MKTLLAALMFFLLTFDTYSQDLIVTTQGDSLNCRIEKVTDRSITFKYIALGEVVTTLIDTKEVVDFKYKFFKEAILGKLHSGSSWQANLNLGYSYRINKIADGIYGNQRSHLQRMRSAIMVGGSLIYFFNKTQGIGLKGEYSTASSDLIGVKEKVNISFIGPMYSIKAESQSKKGQLITNMALGLLTYQNIAEFYGKQKAVGNTLGVGFDLGYDFKISDRIMWGVMLNYSTGVLSSIKINGIRHTLEKENREGLARVGISTGLRFAL